jgi:hypothetical protein
LSVAIKLPFVPIRSINAVVGKFVVPPTLPNVNVEHENGVAAVVDDKNCDGGKRDVPRLTESDNGDRLYQKNKSFVFIHDTIVHTK